MELASDNEAFIVSSDSVLIHAHSMFGAGDDLVDTFVEIAESGFVDVHHRPRELGAPTDRERVDIAPMEPVLEVVLHGRIQSVLGRPAIPNVASHVARTHLENVRLESTFMIIGAEEADTLDLIDWANLMGVDQRAFDS
jgi:hypothetical protein